MQINDKMIQAACAATVLGEGEDGKPVHLEPREARTALEAALPFLPIAVEGKVKPLEWEKTKQSGWTVWRAKGLGVTYECAAKVYNEGWMWGTREGDTNFDAEDEDAAKAAAQFDYETRILSALISSPGKDGGQEVEPPKSLVTVARLAGDDAYKRWRGIDTGLDGMHYIAFHIVRALKLEAQPASTALVERLTSALQPFAQAADDIERTYGNDLPEWQIQFPQLPMSDFRRARSALSASQSTSREGEKADA